MSKTQVDYTISNRCFFKNYQATREVVFRRNKFQFLPIPVFLFWLTIAVQRSITPLKENNQCTISLEARALINNSRVICYQVFLCAFPTFGAKDRLERFPSFAPERRAEWEKNAKYRPRKWIWRHTTDITKQRPYFQGFYSSFVD